MSEAVLRLAAEARGGDVGGASERRLSLARTADVVDALDRLEGQADALGLGALARPHQFDMLRAAGCGLRAAGCGLPAFMLLASSLTIRRRLATAAPYSPPSSRPPRAACAAARRAMGTRYGEHET